MEGQDNKVSRELIQFKNHNNASIIRIDNLTSISGLAKKESLKLKKGGILKRS